MDEVKSEDFDQSLASSVAIENGSSVHDNDKKGEEAKEDIDGNDSESSSSSDSDSEEVPENTEMTAT